MAHPFFKWTYADVAAHEARIKRVPATGDDTAFTPAITREKDLHGLIFDECRRRGWIALHGSMSERSHRTLGEPDFTILRDGGRVLFVECKTARGKLSPDQLAIKAWAEKLGHTVHIVRSMEEFLAIIN
jgi:hypothetical protein